MPDCPPNSLFLIVHTRPGGASVLSIDIERHHDADGVFDQHDIIDDLLRDVEPIKVTDAKSAVPMPPSPPSPLPPPVEVCAVERSVGAEQPSVVRHSRARHTLITDAIIMKYVDVHGPKWRALARSLGGRNAGYNDDIVRNRYIRIMEAVGSPYVTKRARKEAPRKPIGRVERWTAKDDALIRDGVRLFGTKWSDVAKHVGGARTAQATRNRAHRIGADSCVRLRALAAMV